MNEKHNKEPMNLYVLSVVNGARFYEFRTQMRSPVDILQSLKETTEFTTLNSKIRIVEVDPETYEQYRHLPELFYRNQDDIKFFNEIENRIHDLEHDKEHKYPSTVVK